MTDDIYIYEVELPEGIHEMLTPCLGGYTAYIDRRLTWEERQKKVRHIMNHINTNDFERYDVQEIEANAHEV